jgi:hypothetical protein
MQDYGAKLADYALPCTSALDWLAKQIGDFSIVTAYRRGGRRNAVWRLRNRQGDFIFKLHNRRTRWATELFVYRQWHAAFSEFKPDLIASFECDEECLFGLLLAYVDGQPLRDVRIEAQTRRRSIGTLEPSSAGCTT